ncbi:MAG: ExeM/NucH family extracellular endonuclease [Cyanobacteria bacterium J06592_8]
MSDLVITGVVDGPLPGGVPKAVELFALNDIADLSVYGVGSASNGGGTDGEEFTFPADSVTAGDYIYLATESTEFSNFFGFAPDYTNGNATNINGDDAIELFLNASVVDVFGEINIDGTGQPWEYMDGWAYRESGTSPDGTTFTLNNWTFSSPNALDGETSNDTATTPFPVSSFSFTQNNGEVLNEPFDDASQFTTNTSFFSDAGSDFFGISDGSGGGDFDGDPQPNGIKAYTGFEGSFLTGQDLNGEGASLPITVTWSGLDISGLNNLEFSGDFAEFFDDPGDIDAADSIQLTYQIDGGTSQNLLWFSGADFSSTSSPSNGVFREDTDFDGVGDGTALGDAAQTFTAAISGTGSTLDLQLSLNLDSGDEDFGIDNFIIAEPSTTGPSLSIAATDAVKAEGDAGTTPFTFTVTRSDATGTTSVDFAVTSSEADAADFGGVFPSGTVNFADGETSQVITVDVSGDTDPEFDENFTVTLSNPSGDETITTATANGTIQNDDGVAITPISAVQGSGAASPIEGQTVTIEAVVVGDFQDGASGTNGDLNGFFVQEEDADADADPLTSEGLFIFDGNNPAVDVNIGDVVEVTGTVTEFNGLTELTNVTVSIEGTDTLPTPATVNFPVTAVDDLESFEGMGVTIPDTLFVTEYFNLDRFGEVVLSSDGASNEPGTDGRLDQYTDFNTPDQAGFAAYQEEIGKRRIVLDDGQTVQNPDPIILGRGGDPLSATNTLRGGDTVDNLSGVLSFGFGDYRVQPVAPVDFQPTNPRPETPEDVGGDLKVVSFNVLNFFTTLDEDGNPGSGPNDLEPRGANSQAEFDRQIEKLVTTLEIIDGDVVGLIELENEFGDQNGDGQFAIGTLVDELNDRVGAGTYAFVDPGVPFGDTGDAITVGAIYKTDTVQIAPDTTVEFLTDSDLPALGISDTGVFDGVSTNRAPLAVTFEEISTGEVFTVSVNHFKSKGGNGSGDNADIGDGQSNFNGTRVRGAEAVETWLETDPTGSGDDDFLIIGDLNAYAEEDPITFLEGEGYTDLVEEFVGNDASSFVFDGQFGYLDYGLANPALLPQVTGTTEWRINAAEPDALDYNLDIFVNGEPEPRNPNLFNGQEPFRTSDHDPVIIGLDLTSPEPNIINGSRNDDNLPGTPDQDIISGNNGNDTINARGGDDTVEGGRGGDIIRGGGGDDVLAADRVDRFQDFDGQVSELRGGAGNDLIFGGSKDDLIIGGADNDTLLGKNGNDDIRGQSGDDILNGDVGNDVLTGGAGNDTADYSDLAINGVFGTIAGLDANLRTNQFQHSSTNNPLTWTDTVRGVENVTGTQRNDRFISNGQNNIFDGQDEVGRRDRETEFVDLRGNPYTVIGDVVEYRASSNNFSFAQAGDDLIVTGASQQDTLINIEFVKFRDGLFTTDELIEI